MKLTPTVRQELHAAIKDAFPDLDALEVFIGLSFDVPVDDLVAKGDTLDRAVFNLVTWVQSVDQVEACVVALRKARPGNAALLAAERAVLAELEGPDGRAAAEAFGLAPRVPPQVLESIFGRNTWADPGAWREAMAAMERATCRVDFEGRGVGTGFLIAPNRVLTCRHVLDQVGGVIGMSARFGYAVLSNGAEANPGEIVAVRAVLGASPATELDYAVLELARALSDRRPVSLATTEPDASSKLLILSHPQALPLKLSVGSITSLADPTVWYDADTAPGSSGSPVFDESWRLVAVHRQGGAGANGGLRATRIWAHMGDGAPPADPVGVPVGPVEAKPVSLPRPEQSQPVDVPPVPDGPEHAGVPTVVVWLVGDATQEDSVRDASARVLALADDDVIVTVREVESTGLAAALDEARGGPAWPSLLLGVDVRGYLTIRDTFGAEGATRVSNRALRIKGVIPADAPEPALAEALMADRLDAPRPTAPSAPAAPAPAPAPSADTEGRRSEASRLWNEAVFRGRQVEEVLRDARDAGKACVTELRAKRTVAGSSVRTLFERACIVTAAFELGGIYRLPGGAEDTVWLGSGGYGVHHLPERATWKYEAYQRLTLADLLDERERASGTSTPAGAVDALDALKAKAQFPDTRILEDWGRREQAQGEYATAYGGPYGVYEAELADIDLSVRRVLVWLSELQEAWTTFKRLALREGR